MASLKEQQAEANALVDTAKAMVDKVLVIMTLMVDMPSLSLPISTNPIGYLVQLLEHVGVTYEDLKLWLTDFLIYVVPAMEIGVKAVLLTNLKNMISCSIDPRIPEKYRKQHKDPSSRNTPNEYGIDIDIESIDYLDKMSISPLSKYGSDMYFGLNGVDDVYKFARADDFDAFLWFVMHKGKFPMTTDVSADLHEFNDRIHGQGSYHIAEDNPSLFKELNLTPDVKEESSSILPGNTFGYKDASGPNIVSMCIDAFRDDEDQIVHNTLVPMSDDLTSVNWYIRRKHQLGANIFGSYAAAKAEKTEYQKNGVTKRRTTGVKTKNKSRDYSKEWAICNLQYIDPAYGDQRITGLANNKIRFTILPKPYVHIPNINKGEPPWRFKKLLFDAEGEYDPNGKYTIPADAKESQGEEDDDKYTVFTVGEVPVCKLFYKNGRVEVNRDSNGKSLVLTHMMECYPGLTVYEFNYDYVMGLKLFDAKVLASTLLKTVFNTNVGISLNLLNKHQEATDRIKSIIKNIVNSDDSEISDCYFSFDNSKYDELLRRAEEKRARRQSFGNTTRKAGVFDSVNDILKEYDSATELHEQKEILNRAITQAAVTVSEGSDEEDRYAVEYSFVFDLIQNLILAMMEAIMSPKVLMLLEVNQRLMGGTWKKFSVEDLLKAMSKIIMDMVNELKDLLIQELLKLLFSQLEPLKQVLASAIVREKLEYFAQVIDNIIKNCPMIWFKFGNQLLETKLDTVDYADIDVSITKPDEQPKNNKC
jgi:hypothetical protein